MNTFTLTVSAVSKVLFSGTAVYCGVTTLRGAIGFEAHHEPFLGVLADNSAVEYKDASGKEGRVDIKSGMISFRDNRCMVTVGE